MRRFVDPIRVLRILDNIFSEFVSERKSISIIRACDTYNLGDMYIRSEVDYILSRGIDHRQLSRSFKAADEGDFAPQLLHCDNDFFGTYIWTK